MTQSTKQKGRLLENYVADQIVAKGIDPKARANGDSGAGNRDKSDINTSMMVLGQNAGIECKNQKVLKVQDWWKQTKKLESLRMTPILAFHIENEAWEETKVLIYLDTFLDLVKNQGDAQIITGESQNDRDKKWAIQALITACKKLLKFYEDKY